MRTCASAFVLLTLLCWMGLGCAPTQPVVEEPPPPPPPTKVEVTIPGDVDLSDVEGVRRVAVCLAWESQPNGRIIGQGFSKGGSVVEMELAEPLDEVVQRTVISAFKELGFNVALAPALELELAADVRAQLQRHNADYVVTIMINQFLVSTSPVPDAPAFGRANIEMQVFGPGGGRITPVFAIFTKGWKLSGERPGVDDLRRCVEDILKEIKQRVTTDVNLLTSLGLQLPAAAAKQ